MDKIQTIRGLAGMMDNGSGTLVPQKEKMEGANATLKCHFQGIEIILDRDLVEFYEEMMGSDGKKEMTK